MTWSGRRWGSSARAWPVKAARGLPHGTTPTRTAGTSRSAAPRPRPALLRGADDGYATLLVLSLASVVVLLGSVLVALAGVSTARHRAASAADLGALAAAATALQGQSAACARASEVVTAVDASLAACVVRGDVAEVEVHVRPAGPLGELGVARAQARAGPARGAP